MIIGTRVCVLPVDSYAPEYHGRAGTLVKIDDSDEGDAFGVHLDGDTEGHLVYFTQKELAEAQTLEATLNNVNEAEAIATNDTGATIEVTYYAGQLGQPFWIWMEQGLEVVNEEDVHLSFDFEEIGEDIFTDYDLDINAAIWTRKQPEPIAQ